MQIKAIISPKFYACASFLAYPIPTVKKTCQKMQKLLEFLHLTLKLRLSSEVPLEDSTSM